MLFELLVGIHTEGSGDDAVVYQAEKIWNKLHTTVIREYHPIVDSEKDLVAMFPKGKFRRLNEHEEQAWREKHKDDKEASGIALGKDNIPNAAEVQRREEELARIEQEKQEQRVRDAARKGSQEIKPDGDPAALPTGKNVTVKFPTAKSAKLSVYMKPGGKYTVFDDESGKILNQVSIKQEEVEGFVEAYLET